LGVGEAPDRRERGAHPLMLRALRHRRALTGVMSMAGMELASVIRQLRAELNEALADAEGERLRFELGPVEMSLTVTVGREAAPGAKLSRESVQDIKLVLSPVDTQAPMGPGGKAAAPLITGRALEGER